ncbi:MAG: M23 family metallopeptidase [Rhodococcus sp. (in: high G+C Gram-positive bacteria)]|uniref:M23 family metallopeptidase n=1 Tax=Rhodococcus sp. TaxID=1831 RepID=UPI003BAEDDBB
MGSHHRPNGSAVRFEIDLDAARGRHRHQQAGTGVGIKAATVAAATGAIFAGAAQLGAGTAAAAPVHANEVQPGGEQTAPSLPFQLPAGVLPAGFELPADLAAAAQDFVAPDLGAQAQQWLTSVNPVKRHAVQPVSGTLTSNFGSRWGAHHGGIDIAAPVGTAVLAAADGEVIDAGAASGFGLWVRLLHDDGTVTVYGHVNDYSVSVGQQVSAGQQIATVGNRGQSTGPHLHFEVHDANGNKVDPGRWLKERGVAVTWGDAGANA